MKYRIRQNFRGGKLSRMHRSIAIRGKIFAVVHRILQFAGKHSRIVSCVACEDTWQSINPYESVSRPLDRSVMDHEEEFSTEGEIHGYHVYQAIWTPVIDEMLECVREEDNDEDRFAVAVKKSSTIVGHLPRRISALCSAFIRKGGVISCRVTGPRRFCRHLVKGGMEVPCQLTFIGIGKELKKIRCNLARDLCKLAALKASCTEEMSTGLVCKVEDSEAPSCSSSNSVAQDSTSVISRATIDLRDNADIATTNDKDWTGDVWVMHGKHSLKLMDKAAIEQGEELNDKHIQMAQYLAKTQFPVTGGLESTLLQGKKRKGSCTVNTVQIIYCNKRRHWITASTKFGELGKVGIYDTMFHKLDAETRTTVKQLFGLKKAHDINMVAMQCQKGTTDCGLF